MKTLTLVKSSRVGPRSPLGVTQGFLSTYLTFLVLLRLSSTHILLWVLPAGSQEEQAKEILIQEGTEVSNPRRPGYGSCWTGSRVSRTRRLRTHSLGRNLTNTVVNDTLPRVEGTFTGLPLSLSSHLLGPREVSVRDPGQVRVVDATFSGVEGRDGLRTSCRRGMD